MNNVADWSVSPETYREFCAFLQERCGIVLGADKEYLIRSRLVSLLPQFRVVSLDALLQKVIRSDNLTLERIVIDAMTTNETFWFRDVYPFEILGSRILPEVVRERSRIRIWSAACSSGQEPYSIAMVVREQEKKLPELKSAVVDIVASDISDSMLGIAQNGVYDSLAMSRGLSAERRQEFFEVWDQDTGAFRISEDIRKMVSFKRVNLLGNLLVLGKFDIIFCRNVLIYFSREEKLRIVKSFAGMLRPGGYMFLGSSEFMTGIEDSFEMIRLNPGIIFRRLD
ncbi:CheR family methyltransferase [Succinimonas amylolytica]|uniref:CheR family methyltransferase n=1 Tax=Succinimonas amylolytica TaxID=83769 RepID=UPI00037DA540|nr:CheR family methyltransferase [Succinimonas amylolytica]